jgi:hypothetical protein
MRDAMIFHGGVLVRLNGFAQTVHALGIDAGGSARTGNSIRFGFPQPARQLRQGSGVLAAIGQRQIPERLIRGLLR